MTVTTQHPTHRLLQTPNTAPEQARARNNVLRDRFPPRVGEEWWPATGHPLEETARRLTAPPFLPAVNSSRAGRRRGVPKLLRWLSSLPGDTWQQRWKASGAEDLPGAGWTDLPLRFLRQAGPSPSVIRPDLGWMLT